MKPSENLLQHNDRVLCGWRVRSCIALPELLPWLGDERPVDIEISFGQIIEPAEAPILDRPYSRLWADGKFLLFTEKLGRFWVEGGCKIVLDPAVGVAQSELRVFLLGTILGVLCHQRNLLPIHASAVNIDGQAVLIAGKSGTGKSTLAAALGERGHPLVADDIVAINPNGPLVLPAFPQRKLGLDVLKTLGLDPVGLMTNRPDNPKFLVPALSGFTPVPLPPLCIYVLTGAMPEQLGDFQQQDTVKSVVWLNKMIYRRGVGLKVQAPQAILGAIARLVQTAPVFLVPRGDGLPLADLGLLAERVETHALGLRHC